MLERVSPDTLAHHHIASLTEDQKARAKGLLESSGALSAHSTTHPSSLNWLPRPQRSSRPPPALNRISREGNRKRPHKYQANTTRVLRFIESRQS